MAGWKVAPTGVEGVLNNVVAKSATITDSLGGSGSVAGVDKVAEDTVTATQSQVIGSAVVAFFDYEKPLLGGISDRIRASVLGASEATQAIVDGDERMAADTQSKAVAAAATGNFSAFGGR